MTLKRRKISKKHASEVAEARKCPACGKLWAMIGVKFTPQSIASKCRWCGFEQEVPR